MTTPNSWTRLLFVFILGMASTVTFADSTLQQKPLTAGERQIRFEDVGGNDSLLNDVYVRLYLARYQRAQLAVEQEKVLLTDAVRRRERGERLAGQLSISAEELDALRRDASTRAIQVQSLQASQDEAKAFLDIAVTRISLGLEMPICAVLQ